MVPESIKDISRTVTLPLETSMPPGEPILKGSLTWGVPDSVLSIKATKMKLLLSGSLGLTPIIENLTGSLPVVTTLTPCLISPQFDLTLFRPWHWCHPTGKHPRC